MASHYSVIQKYVQWGNYVCNSVIQALSGALQDILDQYYASVIQLETEQSNEALNMHKLIYFVRPNMFTLSLLANLVCEIGQLGTSSGQILSLLHKHVTLSMGDMKSQEMLIELTECAIVPFIEMLQLWILKGVIIDTYQQFFIVKHDEAPNMDADDGEGMARYWDCRYAIKQERIPTFLEMDADIILRTGKYLNVIRQCGHRICPPEELTHLEYSALRHKHSTFIKSAYHYASKTLLELLCGQYNLMGHITSVKRYFLLQQGDLITQFMDASEEELNKNLDKVAPVRLDNLLQLIVRLSSAKNDPCLDNLHCDLFTIDLVTQMSKIHVVGANDLSAIMAEETDENAPASGTQMTGLECFVFQYDVQWPVSIVLNQWALSLYQMLFRLLFYCKHVERQLCRIWIDNKHTCGLFETVEKWRGAFALRQRMLDAIQHIENYMMIEVIEPNWHVLLEKMKTVQNIDDVIVIHQDFLHICVHNCMLSYPDLLRDVFSMSNTCLKFCKVIQSHTENMSKDTVQDLSKEFDGHLVSLLKRINDLTTDAAAAGKLNSLVCRINFNGFYTDKLDQRTAVQSTTQLNENGAADEQSYMAV